MDGNIIKAAPSHSNCAQVSSLSGSQNRLLPVQVGRDGDQERYEFFGQGVVELSRLTTGKAAKEVDELKAFLITHGYPEGTVNRFFAPLASHGLEVAAPDIERGPAPSDAVLAA